MTTNRAVCPRPDAGVAVRRYDARLSVRRPTRPVNFTRFAPRRPCPVNVPTALTLWPAIRSMRIRTVAAFDSVNRTVVPRPRPEVQKRFGATLSFDSTGDDGLLVSGGCVPGPGPVGCGGPL